MKTIGVIGGVGPQATMDFEARVHAVSQRLIPQVANFGYPPMLVYYHRHPPFVVDGGLKPIFPVQPNPHLAAILDKIGGVVDFIVIPSNAPHLLRDFIEKTTGRKVLSMIDVTIEEVTRRGWGKVGIVGYGDPKVYTIPLAQMDIPFETLPSETGGLRDRLDRAILALMAGQAGPDESALAAEAVATIRSKDVDGVILGCTEIPLLLGEAAQAPDLINPAQLLAEAAVRHAMA